MRNARLYADNFESAPYTTTPNVVPFVTPTKHNIQRNTSATSSTSKTRSRAFSDLSAIKEAYIASIGNEIPCQLGQLMKRLYAEGMEAAVIVRAIEATGWAQRPSPQYLRAILGRYEREGIRTIDQQRSDQQAHESRNSARDTGYITHNYTDDFFDGFYYDPTKDYPE